MNLLIIRHKQSEADILEVMEGRVDFNLSDLGQKQAILMADWVARNYKIDKIFSSPLKKASQTVNILSERINISVYTTIQPPVNYITRHASANKLSASCLIIYLGGY